MTSSSWCIGCVEQSKMRVNHTPIELASKEQTEEVELLKDALTPTTITNSSGNCTVQPIADFPHALVHSCSYANDLVNGMRRAYVAAFE
jgi:hypothetical protein